ncbi:response regulator [Streptomyces rubradiris]|uniref:DNA-binding response regulator n=1 Tax=Streptomyces rubradiris TaxID=285531 RepID=A0ABQ3RQT9_STRRR|nr:response regulator transcription factor [Streptomyces rubradiris]GHH24840.1 DNA-binding response regulator [Streptomyces rubradiris]GHI58225.1 DNA-binding response regulator [Streptomyces rubradiris]
MRPTSIVLADDHALFRETLADLLNTQPALAVVGQAADAAQAVRCVAAERPDLLLLDLQMPGSHGAGTVREIIAVSPQTRVLCLSAHAYSYLVEEMLAAGARGFLHKGIGREALLMTLSRTLAEPPHTTVLVPSATADHVPVEEPLSRREHQALVGAAAAMSNRQIADWLGITEGTVKRHLNSVFRKLGAVSRLDAVNKAVRASLIPSPDVHAVAPRRSPGRRPSPVTGAHPLSRSAGG